MYGKGMMKNILEIIARLESVNFTIRVANLVLKENDFIFSRLQRIPETFGRAASHGQPRHPLDQFRRAVTAQARFLYGRRLLRNRIKMYPWPRRVEMVSLPTSFLNLRIYASMTFSLGLSFKL